MSAEYPENDSTDDSEFFLEQLNFIGECDEVLGGLLFEHEEGQIGSEYDDLARRLVWLSSEASSEAGTVDVVFTGDVQVWGEDNELDMASLESQPVVVSAIDREWAWLRLEMYDEDDEWLGHEMARVRIGQLHGLSFKVAFFEAEGEENEPVVTDELIDEIEDALLPAYDEFQMGLTDHAELDTPEARKEFILRVVSGEYAGLNSQEDRHRAGVYDFHGLVEFCIEIFDDDVASGCDGPFRLLEYYAGDEELSRDYRDRIMVFIENYSKFLNIGCDQAKTYDEKVQLTALSDVFWQRCGRLLKQR